MSLSKFLTSSKASSSQKLDDSLRCWLLNSQTSLQTSSFRKESLVVRRRLRDRFKPRGSNDGDGFITMEVMMLPFVICV